MSQNSLTILSIMSLDFEAFLEPSRLIAIDICSLSTFLKVKVEFNSFIFNSKYTWMVIASSNKLIKVVITIIVVKG